MKAGPDVTQTRPEILKRGPAELFRALLTWRWILLMDFLSKNKYLLCLLSETFSNAIVFFFGLSIELSFIENAGPRYLS